MSRYFVLPFAVVAALAGCNRAPTTQAVNVPAAPTPIAAATEFPELPQLPPVGSQVTEPDRGGAALASAFGLLNEGKLPEAFAAFKQAQTIQDSAMVRTAIAGVELRLAAAALADKVATEIRGILDDGRADLAAQLASDALRAFGDGAPAEMFASLKRQADALNTVGLEPPALVAGLKKEFDDAVASQNLRAVVLAIERAMAIPGDSETKKTYDELRERLRRHDDAMLRAAEHRRSPDRLEDAVATLREAAQVWDTPESRRCIDECVLAQRSRRERVVIAEFEVRGDIPAVAVSRAVADELTLAFKRQFDVVAREKWKQVSAELKLGLSELLGDAPGRREFSRLTGARYLICGSVAAIHGVTVNARLIDLRSGVIIQTARVAGASAESVLPSLPQLVAMLQMNDDQRLAYETLLSGLGSPLPIITALAGLPADPEFVPSAVPTPIVVASYRSSATGGVSGDEIRALSTSNANARVIPNDHPARARAFAVAVELGDSLFRRGLYREAHAQYQVATSLTPEPFELTSRIDKCRPYLPPKSSSPFRPRIAVFDFVSSGDGAATSLGSWLADNIAGYFSPQYQVVPRDEISWYLGRLGLTLRDVVADPAARFYLARALDARFLVLGAIRSGAAGLELSATLLDAESGNRLGSGELRIDDRKNVRPMLAELVRSLSGGGPSGQAAVAGEGQRIESLLKDAEIQAGIPNFAAAFDLLNQADKLQPGGPQIQALRERLEERKRQIGLDSNQESDSRTRQSLVDAERANYGALMRAAETARAATAARSLGQADRQSAREAACGRLTAQARTARSASNFELAEQLLATALALQPRPEIAEQLGQIRAQTAALSRMRSAKDAAAAEEIRRRQYDTELAAARSRLEKERRENAAGEQRMQAQRDADRREYLRLVEKAKAAQLTGQFDTAFAALFSARRIQPGDEADRLIASARGAQVRAIAQEKGDRTVKDLESRVTSDTAARNKLEQQIKRNQNFYSEAMNAAEQALRFRQYDRAIKQFQDALKLIRSEVALEGLRQALDEQAQAKSAADIEAQRASTDRRGENEAARLLIVGRADFDAGKFDEAFLSFRRAKDLAPTNADVIAWLAKAEKARLEQRTSQRTQPTTSTKAHTAKTEADQGEKSRREGENSAKNQSETKPAADPSTRLREDFNRLVEQGRSALANRRFEDAQKALDNALRLVPGDKEAERLLLQARDGAQPIVAYTRHLQAASALEKQEKFAEALQEYKEALKVLPNDPAAMKRADYVLHMDAGTRLFKDNKKSESAKEFEAALKIAPDDAAAKTWLRKTKTP